jgi:hypothetical protein
MPGFGRQSMPRGSQCQSLSWPGSRAQVRPAQTAGHSAAGSGSATAHTRLKGICSAAQQCSQRPIVVDDIEPADLADCRCERAKAELIVVSADPQVDLDWFLGNCHAWPSCRFVTRAALRRAMQAATSVHCMISFQSPNR